MALYAINTLFPLFCRSNDGNDFVKPELDDLYEVAKSGRKLQMCDVEHLIKQRLKAAGYSAVACKAE